MSDKFGPYCIQCNMFMIRITTKFIVEINDGYDIVRGNAYKCPVCGQGIAVNFGKPYPNISHQPYII